MNGEGIDYGLESGMLAADLFVDDPATASERYDTEVGERFDAFLRTGRRFSFLIGHPWILKTGLRFSVSTESIANITLAVMGNLVDNDDARRRRQGDVARRQGPRPRRPRPAQDPRRRLTPPTPGPPPPPVLPHPADPAHPRLR